MLSRFIELFQAHVNSTYDTQTLTCNSKGMWEAVNKNTHQTLPSEIKKSTIPLFKCEPVRCTHLPPVLPEKGCNIVLPTNIHNCNEKIFAAERAVENQPDPSNETQYETKINYTCPSSAVAQSSVEYLKGNFSFDFPNTNSLSTYIPTLQAYCEIDK